VDRTTAVGNRFYCVPLLLIDTGVGISELVSIKIADIDWVRERDYGTEWLPDYGEIYPSKG
jgi:integrase